MTHTPLNGLIEQLAILPGVGPKSAQRLAFFLLSLPKESVQKFASEIVGTRDRIRYCDQCYNISFESCCSVCLDPGRTMDQMCVVATPKDLLLVERAGVFRGVYHVLGGVLSPLDGIHPDMLRIGELTARLKAGSFSEVILAINPTIEGDTTALFLMKVLASFNVQVTRLAHGLPVGSDLEYADELTLQQAFQGRAVLESESRAHG